MADDLGWNRRIIESSNHRNDPVVVVIDDWIRLGMNNVE